MNTIENHRSPHGTALWASGPQRLWHWIATNTFTPSWWPHRINRHPLGGYLLAVLLQVLATGAALALAGAYPSLAFPSALTLLAVAFVALSWGAGPSLLATLVAVLLFASVTVPHRAPVDAPSLALLLAVGGLISAVGSRSERLRRVALAAHAAADAATWRLQTVQAVSDAALAHLDREGLLHEVLDRVSRALHVDSTAILLLDEVGHDLVPYLTRGPSVVDQVRVPLGHGIAGQIAAQRVPLIIDDLRTRAEADPALQTQVRSLLGVPLHVEERVIGVLLVAARALRPFTQDDLHLLQCVADRIALALDHARLYQAERDARAQAAERARELDVTLDQAPVGIAHVGLDGRWRLVNQTLCDVVGYSRADLLQRTFQEVTHPDDLAANLAAMDRLLAGEIPSYSLEKRYLRPDLIPVWIRLTVALVRTPWGAPHYFISVVEDITARMDAQRRLTEATTLLADSLDAEAALADVASAAVPYLADWCMVAVIEPNGHIRRRAGTHVDPARRDLLRQMEHHYARDATASLGELPVLRTGQPELYSTVSQALLQALAGDAERLEVVRRLGLVSTMIVPLVARGHILGALSFASANAGRHYGPADLVQAQDLASRAALAMDNARLYQEVQQAVRVRDDFLIAAAHDLRTPLTSIKGYADMVGMRLEAQQSEPGAGEVEWLRAHVERVRAAARRLEAAVDAISDAAQLRMGHTLALSADRVELGTLARDVARLTADAYAQGATPVEVVCAPGVLVQGDRVRLDRVLQNVIGNAILYSPKGMPVRVEVGQQEGWAIITVQDQGIGIPREELPRIFTRFYRASTARSITGTGIGLAGSRAIVEQHGGRITLESTLGVGTTVTIQLPVAHAISN